MKKSRLMLLLSFLVAAQMSFGARARSEWKVFHQPDGTTITARLCGDEWFDYYQAQDGTPLKYDTAKKGLCYADAIGFDMMSTGLLAHEAKERTAEEWKSLGDMKRVDEAASFARSMAQRRLASPSKNWDPDYVYRSLVVLIEFADSGFQQGHDAAFYDDLFNKKGFNQGKGPGCITEYFCQQSNGMCNMAFDVVGPVKVKQKMRPNTSKNYGTQSFREAVMALDTIDFSRYDWNGNGSVEQVVFIYAGPGGNEPGSEGFIWPSSGGITSIMMKNVRVDSYTASAELWASGKSCGIGTVCHEFSHCLGLPDFYPTSNQAYMSVVDEWDLMDGGNFINNGWCPCNYSAHEKDLFGWVTPVELTEACSIKDLDTPQNGGITYQISNPSNPDEKYFFENRQWRDWDLCTPGHGLLVTYVDYKSSVWNGNSVNNTVNHHRMEQVHADNRDYLAWETKVADEGLRRTNGHSPILSGSPYPYYENGTLVNDSLTDISVPAMTWYTGNTVVDRPLTNIIESTDSLISFDFMGGDPSAIRNVEAGDQKKVASDRTFDLLGRPADKACIIVRNGKKYVNR